jgi:hypothetical protein
MAKPTGRPNEQAGDTPKHPDQFAFEVAQEIGVDLGRVDPQQVAAKEKRLHRKGKRRS